MGLAPGVPCCEIVLPENEWGVGARGEVGCSVGVAMLAPAMVGSDADEESARDVDEDGGEQPPPPPMPPPPPPPPPPPLQALPGVDGQNAPRGGRQAGGVHEGDTQGSSSTVPREEGDGTDDGDGPRAADTTVGGGTSNGKKRARGDRRRPRGGACGEVAVEEAEVVGCAGTASGQAPAAVEAAPTSVRATVSPSSRGPCARGEAPAPRGVCAPCLASACIPALPSPGVTTLPAFATATSNSVTGCAPRGPAGCSTERASGSGRAGHGTVVAAATIVATARGEAGAEGARDVGEGGVDNWDPSPTGAGREDDLTPGSATAGGDVERGDDRAAMGEAGSTRAQLPP